MSHIRLAARRGLGAAAALALAAALAIAPGALARAASPATAYAMSIPGYPTIDLVSWSFGVSSPASAAGATGQGAKYTDLTVVKEWSPATPKLFAALLDAQHFAQITLTGRLTVRKAGKPVTEVLAWKFSALSLTNVNYEGDPDRPYETLTFTFSSVTETAS